jgi:hypothetical protein
MARTTVLVDAASPVPGFEALGEAALADAASRGAALNTTTSVAA